MQGSVTSMELDSWDTAVREDFKLAQRLKVKSRAQETNLRKKVDQLSKERRSFISRFAGEKAKLFRSFNRIRAERITAKQRLNESIEQQELVPSFHGSGNRATSEAIAIPEEGDGGPRNCWLSVSPECYDLLPGRRGQTPRGATEDIPVSRPKSSSYEREGEWKHIHYSDGVFLTTGEFASVFDRPRSVNDLKDLHIDDQFIYDQSPSDSHTDFDQFSVFDQEESRTGQASVNFTRLFLPLISDDPKVRSRPSSPSYVPELPRSLQVSPNNPRKEFLPVTSDSKFLSKSMDSVTIKNLRQLGASETSVSELPPEKLNLQRCRSGIATAGRCKPLDLKKLQPEVTQQLLSPRSPSISSPNRGSGSKSFRFESQTFLSPGSPIQKRVCSALDQNMSLNLSTNSPNTKSKEELDFYRRALSGNKLPVSPSDIRQRTYSAGDANVLLKRKAAAAAAAKLSRTMLTNDNPSLVTTRKTGSNTLKSTCESKSSESINSNSSERKSSETSPSSVQPIVSIVVEEAVDDEEKDDDEVELFSLDDDWKLQAIPFRKRSSTFNGMSSKPICRLPEIKERSPTPETAAYHG